MENEGRKGSPCWNSWRKTEKKRKEREIERKEGKGKEMRRREEDELLPPFFLCSVDQGAGFVHAPRGRCFLLLWLFLLKGHSMAIRFSPNSRAGPNTVSTELLTV